VRERLTRLERKAAEPPPITIRVVWVDEDEEPEPPRPGVIRIDLAEIFATPAGEASRAGVEALQEADAEA